MRRLSDTFCMYRLSIYYLYVDIPGNIVHSTEYFSMCNLCVVASLLVFISLIKRMRNVWK